ncbi:BRCA1-associated protein homolog 2-like [Quercus lobata]|uniref:BRCA1-associated protein homolog 2-like n=1 Tax=Quercus lobata TaxID=97700 RepID=UPI0012442985|nr:BRCA1-associated protein homolog 2-like [Quercus lobata]
MSLNFSRTCDFQIWQRPSQPTNQQQPQIEVDDKSNVFLIEFHITKVDQWKNYIGNSQEPVSSYEDTKSDTKLVFLSKREVMSQDINGGCLCSLLRKFEIPVEDHGTMIRQIVGLAGTSTMPIVVNIIHVYLMEILVPNSYMEILALPIVDPVRDYDTIILDSMETYEPKSIPATKSSIEALEKIMFQPSSNSIQECSICLEEFQTGFAVTRMPCSHVYHGKCIAKWLQTSHFCPLCRYPMPHYAS